MKTSAIYIITGLALLFTQTKAQFITKYPDIPRIDVHSHPGNDYSAIRSYLIFRNQLLSRSKVDVAMWINLSSRSGGYSAIDTITEVSKGRIMTCISDYYPENGLTYTAEDISSYLEKGYVGYKIWSGRNHLDNPAHEAVYTAMEKAGMVMASVHIAGPNAPFG